MPLIGVQFDAADAAFEREARAFHLQVQRVLGHAGKIDFDDQGVVGADANVHGGKEAEGVGSCSRKCVGEDVVDPALRQVEFSEGIESYECHGCFSLESWVHWGIERRLQKSPVGRDE